MTRRVHAVDAYAAAVVAGEVPAGRYHRLACERHQRDRQRDAEWPWEFRPELADQVVAFFGQLKHYRGEWASRPIILEPWQVFVVGSTFGWVSRATGLRRFRKAYIELARKSGKSLLAAGVSLYATFFDGEPGAEGYVAAMKRDQAKIVFGDAKRLVQTSGLKSRIQVNVGNMHRLETACKLEPLSADHDSMDGLNVHCCILDEYHAQKDRGVVDVIETAMGARRQPLLFAITTAGSDALSPCGIEHDYAQKLLDRVIDDETFFTFIAHADVDDDVFAEATWVKANPNWGVSVKPEDMRALAAKAKHMPSALASFRQKRLCQWVRTSTPWLNLEGWRAGQHPLDVGDLVGRPCWGGVDLSSKTDLSAFVLAFPPGDDCARWRLLCWFWTPDIGLEAREQAARAPYRQWVDEGHLIAVEGTRIDQGAIQAAILEARDRFDVRLVGADPWNAEKLVGDVNEALGDDRMVVIDQTYLQLSGPSKEFEAAVSAGRIDAGDHPVLGWMAANAVVALDANENIKPTKDPRKTRGRIDGIVAAIMAMKLAQSEMDEPEIVPEVRSLTW